MTMKRLFAATLMIVAIFLCLFSCERSEYAMEQDAKREAIYNRGYEVGYEAGYENGRCEGFEDAQSFVEDELFSLEHDIKHNTGISPEQALQILMNYADGEPTSETELKQAILTINQFYWNANNIVHEIEDNWWQ